MFDLILDLAMNCVLDIIVIAFVFLAFIINFKRGLIKSIWKIAALILTIVLVTALKNPAVNFIAETEFANNMYNSIQERITVDMDEMGIAEAGGDAGLPEYIVAEMVNAANYGYDIQNVVYDGTNEVARRLTMLMIRIIVIVGLFILIRILLALAFTFLSGIAKLPVLKQANRLLGGLLGIINSLALIYIGCAILSLIPLSSTMYNLINQSYIVKYFYNYNILLQLIMKI